MKKVPLRAEALAAYVARLQADPNDVYAAHRIQERSHVHRFDRATLRAAVRALLANDPWFMADRLSRLGDATFTVAELKALEPYVGRGLPAGTAAYLRACFWLRAFGWFEHRRVTARQALLHLRRVPAALRVVDWHEMVFDSHRRAGDFAGCRRSFPRLFAATDPAWRAHSLHGFLHEAAARRQWTIYDR